MRYPWAPLIAVLFVLGALLGACSPAYEWLWPPVYTVPLPPPQPPPAPLPPPPPARPLQPAAPGIVAPFTALPPAEVHPVPPPVVQPRPISVPERKPKKRVRPVVIPQRRPSAEECAQIASGISIVGRAGVKVAALARGYTEAQVEWALRKCGL